MLLLLGRIVNGCGWEKLQQWVARLFPNHRYISATHIFVNLDSIGYLITINLIEKTAQNYRGSWIRKNK
jgi:hypothetical protein